MMWGFKNQLLNEIVIAIIISVLGYICGIIYKKCRSIFYKKTMSFSVDGLWYSRHKNYNGESIIEIIQFKQDREDILMKIIQYKSQKDVIYSFSGRGIFTTDIISLFYYSDSRELRQNGVMTLKISSHDINEIFMKGTYYEINSERSGNQGFYPFGEYKIFRLNVSFFKRINFKMKNGIFLNYSRLDEALKMYEEKKWIAKNVENVVQAQNMKKE